MRFWFFLGIILTAYYHFGSGKKVGTLSKTDCSRSKNAEISPKNVYIMIISNMAVGNIPGIFISMLYFYFHLLSLTRQIKTRVHTIGTINRLLLIVKSMDTT